MQNRRHLKKPSFVLEKLSLYARSRWVAQPDDVLMAFYPKTGSTWVRFFLYNMLTGSTSTASFDEVNAAMPEYGNPSMFAPWRFPDRPRLVKTHRPYSPLLFGSHPTMLVVRDPRDIVVSLFHYARSKRTIDFDGALEKLVYDEEIGMEAFFKHYVSWAPRAGLIVRYEDLKATPIESFGAICAFCGIEATPEAIEAALAKCSVQRMRDAQKASTTSFKDHDPNFVFARKATVGQWEEHLDERARAHYRALCETYDFHLYD